MKRRTPTLPAAPVDTPSAALRVGPCIEVWADVEAEDDDPDAPRLARHRWNRARSAWLDQAGILTDTDRRAALPWPEGAWSASYLVSTGRTGMVAARLSAVGCTVADLPALAQKADELLSTLPPVPRRRDMKEA